MTERPIPPRRIEPLEPERRGCGPAILIAVVVWAIVGTLIWWFT